MGEQAGAQITALQEEVARLRARIDELEAKRPLYSKSVVKRLAVQMRIVGEPRKVPEGWKLVPIEPTDEMLDIGCEITGDWRVELAKAWKAMLDAAPGLELGDSHD